MLSQRRRRFVLIMVPKVVFWPLCLSIIIIKYLIMLVFINSFSMLECKFLILCSQNTNIYENIFYVINFHFVGISRVFLTNFGCMSSSDLTTTTWAAGTRGSTPRSVLALLHIVWTFWTVWHISILLLKITSSIYFRCPL